MINSVYLLNISLFSISVPVVISCISEKFTTFT